MNRTDTGTDTEPVESVGERASSYRWTLTLWPLAVIFHLAANDFNLVSFSRVGIVQIPFAIAAVVMLVRPSTCAALTLALAHVAVIAVKLPAVGNHEVLLLLMHLAVALAIAGYRDRWLSVTIVAWRWVLLIAYAAIAFSKLNRDFFDPAVSCAVVFGDEFGRWVDVSVSDSAVLAATMIAITVIAELAIPVLLMIRPLRRYGVVFGLAFHSVLALEPRGHVFDFTSVLFVLFPVFLVEADAERVSGAVERWRRRWGEWAIAAVVLIAISNVGIYQLRQQRIDLAPWLIEFPIWLGYAGFVLRQVLPAATRRGRDPRLAFRIAPIMAVVVALTSLNAIAPYTEIRTAGAFNMYSNLMTYDGQTNHLVVPTTFPLRAAPRLFATQYEPGQQPILPFYGQGAWLIPENNLATWAQSNPNLGGVKLEVVHGQDRGRVIEAGELQRDGAMLERFVDRLGYIRSVDLDAPVACQRYWGPAH